MADFEFSFDIPESSAPAQPGHGSDQIDVSDTASGAILSERKKRRKRSGTIGSGAGAAQDAGSGLSAEDEKALDALFDPAQWQAIVEAPANAAILVTGSNTWKLSDKESERLAVGASTCARYFMPTHPKWIALSLFGIGLASVYGSHFVAYKLEQQKLRAQNKNPRALQVVGDS